MSRLSIKVPDDVVIDQSTYSSTYGKFILSPLEKGYGMTIGNSLRRVLLNAIPGSAITSIRIDGAQHEFSTVKGIVEDISDIILNLKEVRAKLLQPKADKISLHLKGPGEFKAADIQKETSQLEILNPEHHIITVEEDADFKMDIKFERGKGYVPAAKNKKPDSSIGTIFLDSIFTPVLHVNYEVEATRVEGKTDYEKLILQIRTDGSVTPDDAVSQAAKVLRDHLSLFVLFESDEGEEEPREEEEDIARIRKQLTRSIDELELSVRSHNCLRAAEIEAISDLVSKSEQEMLKFKNFGRKSLLELQQKLGELGLTFDMDVKRYLGDDDL